MHLFGEVFVGPPLNGCFACFNQKCNTHHLGPIFYHICVHKVGKSRLLMNNNQEVTDQVH